MVINSLRRERIANGMGNPLGERGGTGANLQIFCFSIERNASDANAIAPRGGKFAGHPGVTFVMPEIQPCGFALGTAVESAESLFVLKTAGDRSVRIQIPV